MFSRISIISGLAIILSAGIVAVAQQTQTQAPTTPEARMKARSERLARRGEFGKRRGRMGHRGGIGRLTRELNLTEEQRQQSRAIMQLNGMKYTCPSLNCSQCTSSAVL